MASGFGPTRRYMFFLKTNSHGSFNKPPFPKDGTVTDHNLLERFWILTSFPCNIRTLTECIYMQHIIGLNISEQPHILKITSWKKINQTIQWNVVITVTKELFVLKQTLQKLSKSTSYTAWIYSKVNIYFNNLIFGLRVNNTPFTKMSLINGWDNLIKHS